MDDSLKHRTWNDLIQELEQVENTCVDAGHFIVTNLQVYVLKQKDYMTNLIAQGTNPKKDKTAKLRKQMLIELSQAVKNPLNRYELNTLPKRQFSTYPLKEDI